MIPNNLERGCTPRVLQFVPGFFSGGIESLLMGLLRCMDNSRLQFDFLVDTQEALPEFEEIRSAGGRVFQLGRFLDAPFRYQREVGRILDTYSEEYLAVHCHTVIRALPILLAARRRGIRKRILHSHTDSLQGSRQALIAPAISAATAPLATDFWACSDAAGRFFFGRRAFKVFRNTIRTSQFAFDSDDRSRVRLRLGIDSCDLVIGHTGRFTFQKNHDWLIRVFASLHAQCPNTRLLLVGEGPLKAEMRSLTEALGVADAVCFVGLQSDVAAYLSAMDVFFLPSHYEGFCISLLEAQANGLPCLAADVIQDDVQVTPLVRTCSLDEPLEHWTDALMGLADRKQDRKGSNVEIIRTAGFDTALQLEQLIDMYHQS
ncbi:glycosyltransferase [Halomonas sp. H10-9-1]|uniref:glycosyltransferase n=1 Tax=Halomonas sp. H10-9-1 TaxID=2950871 RepID=UPI0032E03C03